MIDPKIFDEITKKFTDAMPTSLKEFKEDMERNMRAILQSSFQKLDLVTREELDRHLAVLQKTRAKLEEMERRLDELEKTYETKGKTSKKIHKDNGSS